MDYSKLNDLAMALSTAVMSGLISREEAKKIFREALGLTNQSLSYKKVPKKE